MDTDGFIPPPHNLLLEAAILVGLNDGPVLCPYFTSTFYLTAKFFITSVTAKVGSGRCCLDNLFTIPGGKVQILSLEVVKVNLLVFL